VGEYQWRRDGEYHLFNPDTVFKLHVERSVQAQELDGTAELQAEAGRRPARVNRATDVAGLSGSASQWSRKTVSGLKR